MSERPMKTCPVCGAPGLLKAHLSNRRAGIQCMKYPFCQTSIAIEFDEEAVTPDAARLALSVWDELERPATI